MHVFFCVSKNVSVSCAYTQGKREQFSGFNRTLDAINNVRSEERRVGKEYRIWRQNAQREKRLRMGKRNVADVLAAQPVTTNLLIFFQAEDGIRGRSRHSC